MKEYKEFLVDDNLNIYSKRTKMKLTPHKGSNGYVQVMCRDKNGKHIHERVHVIYANCFIDNPYNHKYVNHIDCNKQNNDLENLEWCSNRFNVLYCWRTGNRTHKNNTHIKITDTDGEEYEFKSIRMAAKEFNLDRHKVSRILKGELNNIYNYKIEYVK